jgi:hypothetical protein
LIATKVGKHGRRGLAVGHLKMVASYTGVKRADNGKMEPSRRRYQLGFTLDRRYLIGKGGRRAETMHQAGECLQ